MAKNNEQEQEQEQITRCYAVPDYITPLLKKITELSEEDKHKEMMPPGHRFGLYFKGWQQAFKKSDGEEVRVDSVKNWLLHKEQKNAALKEVTLLGKTAEQLSAALLKRQQAMTYSSTVFYLYAQNTSPFMTGMGNEHPVENGFAFLSPYGVPYLAGSGIKGMLLRAAKYLAKSAMLKEHQHQRAGWSDAAINTLFGSADTDEAGKPIQGRQGALRFWDCFPQVANSTLAVEIMTPHNGDYLQGDSTPHTSGQPVPIPFLAIPPKSDFHFFIQADVSRLAPPLRDSWQDMLKAAFFELFHWVGMGAKTAVGYGQMDFNHDELSDDDKQFYVNRTKFHQEQQRAFDQEKERERQKKEEQERKLKAEEEARQKERQRIEEDARRQAELAGLGMGEEEFLEQAGMAELQGYVKITQNNNPLLFKTPKDIEIWNTLPAEVIKKYKKNKKPISVIFDYKKKGLTALSLINIRLAPTAESN
ncbi:type III-B CRISPR module RAMP protein Cmr6 [Pokkaliibacter sp. MBI-7]|uniref:type III-B CRISPR module RAMP protein Cmr6 n=1 Tax=Pokkaliibacter sp. MBI-7 TaxID=3040600 RepID=UPI00244CE006|nr:type III-B CRISPR module RAMP protein Cmr6 [Pokkaliibacter sp. MBI-7]MDH2431444.1 type III-B CRISPR module RAMP protein Cmr6 [Pokkaliibacter sp. MBI-7]